MYSVCDTNPGSWEWTKIDRILAPGISDPGISTVVMLLCGKRDSADVIKVINQLTLKQGNNPGLPGGPM